MKQMKSIPIILTFLSLSPPGFHPKSIGIIFPLGYVQNKIVNNYLPNKKPHLSLEKWGLIIFHRHSLGKRLSKRKPN